VSGVLRKHNDSFEVFQINMQVASQILAACPSGFILFYIFFPLKFIAGASGKLLISLHQSPNYLFFR
jgi:hypothetical protein